jgi:exodeoxyribonuclease V alpha subunit
MSETPDHLTLSGRFERKLFHDPQQSFLIGKMRLQSGVSIVVTGNLFGMGEPKMGDVLTAHGNWVVHPTRGRQFQAMTISSPPQVTPKGFYAWLRRGAVDGVGKATVDALESRFRDEILTFLDQPELLAQEAKITPMRAQAIAEGWNIASKNPLEETFIWLVGFGVKNAHARKIVTRYGIDTRTILEENPWRVADEIEGIGFETADKLALAMGRTEADAQRIRACLYHVIDQSKRDGHWGLPIQDLKIRTARLVGAAEATVMEVIKAAVAEQKLIWDNEFKPGLVRTPFQVKVEEQIASILVDAILTPLEDIPNDETLRRYLDDIVEEMQDEMDKPDFSFNEQQETAILMAVKNRVLVITGGPGVGKTTIQKGIIRLMNRIDDEIEIARAAPTGRAAKRMTEAAPHERADVAQTQGNRLKALRRFQS